MSKDKDSKASAASEPKASTPLVPVQTPTIGRQLWFWESGAKRAAASSDPAVQPEAATVIYVIDDRCVNVQVISLKGRVRTVLRACLVQPADPWNDTTGPHCAWMPYQQAQHTKAVLEGAK